MVFPWLAVGMGAFSAGQSLLGSYSKRQAQKAKNKAAIKRYHGRVATQKRKWYQDLSIWHNKSRVTAPLKQNAADMAAQRGYAQAQQGLNTLMYEAAQKNSGILTKYLQETKGAAGAKSQGASSNRMQRMNYGALMKAQFENTYMTARKGNEAYQRNVEDIHRKVIGDTNKINAIIMFKPDTPPPITFDPDSLGQEALGPLDFLGAGLAGVTEGLKH